MSQDGRSETWQAVRKVAALRDGYRCCYCKVPTAATIEHLEARSTGKAGVHRMDNLRLCCPYCNSAKGDESLESFVARKGWKLDVPDDLPRTTRQMLETCFGIHADAKVVHTSSTNARLRIAESGQVIIEVRSGKKEPWFRVGLGDENHPRVARAAWVFLRRHFTPATPGGKTQRRRRSS